MEPPRYPQCNTIGVIRIVSSTLHNRVSVLQYLQFHGRNANDIERPIAGGPVDLGDRHLLQGVIGALAL
jgi:hypothetical protein